MSQRVSIAVFMIWVASTAGCGTDQDHAASKVKPAEVAHHVLEEDLNTVKLTEKAEQRLGIRLGNVELAEVRRGRTVGGEVVIPPGQQVVVSAPIAGTLSGPVGAPLPAPGAKLEIGQPIFRFKPLLTPERDVLTPAERVRVAQTKADVATAQLEAERQVQATRIAVETAQIAYDRAVQLLQNKAGSQRRVDEAEAQLKLARENHATAQARYEFLSGIELDQQAGELASHVIVSPVAGVLQSVEAAAGETVGAGERLFSVIQTDPVWIRVPIYVGHWREVDTGQPASIAEYGDHTRATLRSARYVSAPPSANPNATTVDLFYELANADGQLYPGQRLSVTLPLQGSQRSLVVPFPAVLYDVHGGEWVYEQRAEHTYARRRIAISYVDGNTAVLSRGPAPGTKVVTDGAVELFGTEFGVGH